MNKNGGRTGEPPAAGPMAIRVVKLSKMFKIYNRPADMFWEMLTSEPRYKPFWALRDITFEVARGHVVGIIGRNGAGKSTLLRIITGTLDKTSGLFTVGGRISSILELGTGFNGEYSGRQNIYLGGMMVGMTREEIRRKEEWIIQFSELEEFIDQPFKTYSTGMQARLTFATAVCVDPDILIVDEALSVGDARFQRKSFAKIEEFRKSGRTILLVSHDLNTINTFCDQAILLERGEIIEQGEPYRVTQIYHKMSFSDESMPGTAVTRRIETSRQAESPASLELNPAHLIHEKGFAWAVDLSEQGPPGDSNEKPEHSEYYLYEDQTRLRPGHCPHEQIRSFGHGAYSHWGQGILFSSSDNSNPKTNGRRYILRHQNSVVLFPSGGAALNDSEDRRSIKNDALRFLGLEKSFEQSSPHLMRTGNGKAEILDIGILNSAGERMNFLKSGEKYTFFFIALFYEHTPEVSGGFIIRNIKGLELFGISMKSSSLPLRSWTAGEVLELRLSITMRLTNGVYFLTAAVSEQGQEGTVLLDSWSDGVQFEIARNPFLFHSSVVDLGAEMEVIERSIGRDEDQ